MSVIVVTQDHDGTADAVVAQLHTSGTAVVRGDVAQLRIARDATGNGEISNGQQATGFDAITGVYWRRPSPAPDTEQALSAAAWAGAERYTTVTGALAALPALWINQPWRNQYAAQKPVQWALARDCGLNVPETVVTDDPAQARKHLDDGGQWVYKPTSGAAFDQDGDTQLAFVTAVTSVDLDRPEAWQHPLVLQRRVDKVFDVRVTYVDGHMFPAKAVSAFEGKPLDWRTEQDTLRWETVRLPLTVKLGLRRMMEALGLVFATFDVSYARDNTWWFLDLNPNGQWWWEQPDRDAIAETLASALRGEPG